MAFFGFRSGPQGVVGRDDEGRSAASGVYLYQLIGGEDFTAVGRMALVR